MRSGRFKKNNSHSKSKGFTTACAKSLRRLFSSPAATARGLQHPFGRARTIRADRHPDRTFPQPDHQYPPFAASRFCGRQSLQQAYDRGVRLIGATSHYVTEELDAGPIIAQETKPVDHTKSVSELIDLGRELETLVLRRAVELHVRRRIIVDRKRTIIFD